MVYNSSLVPVPVVSNSRKMTVRFPRKIRNAAVVVVVTVTVSIQITLYLWYSHHGSHLIRSTDEPLLPERIVHLDFKGGAPKLSFLRDLLPLLSSAGATGLLVEYEDYFPYSGSLRNLSSRSAWSPAEVEAFLEVAHAAELQVTPLVQTLGHLEFALKLAENINLRENAWLPDTACPSAPAVRDLISEMIRQVLSLHPQSKTIHLGMDEARLWKSCSRCQSRQGVDVFIEHIKWAVSKAVKLRPEVRVLIWDDMFRYWPLEGLFGVAPLWRTVQPVVWAYSRGVIIEIPARTWLGYQRTMPSLWIASAYMGADGHTALIPNVSERLHNHMEWLKRSSDALISSTRSKSDKALTSTSSLSQVNTLVLTGWTRYDHFGALCENLPLGVHSLVLMLSLVSGATPSEPVQPVLAANRWKKLLNCPQEVLLPIQENLNQDPFLWSAALCSYPGSDLFRAVQRLWSVHKEVESMQREYRCRTGWLSLHSVSRNWTPTARLLDVQKVAGKLSDDLKLLRNELDESLSHYFDVDTTGEWLSQNVKPLQAVLRKLAHDAKSQRRRLTWPRGPPPVSQGDDSPILC